ncbi:PTS fructose transporter subunit IIC, partial [Lacticaseibacillus rhamnosus]
TFTMLFTTLFGNIQTLGTAVAGVAKSFTTTFNGLSMLAIALIGFAFAAISYQQSTQLHDSVGGSGANGGEKAAKKTN